MEGPKLWLQYHISALRQEDGAAAVEYGLLVGLIAVAIILTVTALGGQLNTMFSSVQTALSNVNIPASS